MWRMRTRLRTGSAAKRMSREGDKAEDRMDHVYDKIVYYFLQLLRHCFVEMMSKS